MSPENRYHKNPRNRIFLCQGNDYRILYSYTKRGDSDIILYNERD